MKASCRNGLTSEAVRGQCGGVALRRDRVAGTGCLYLAVIAAAGFALSGCHAGVAYRTSSPPGAQSQGLSMRVAVPVEVVVGAVLMGTMAGGGVVQGAERADMAPAQPDPSRRISVQDCTRPVDFTAGNLVCR